MNNAWGCLNESSGSTVGENVTRCTMFNKGIDRARVLNDGKLILQKSSEGLSFRSDGQNQIVSAGRCEKWGPASLGIVVLGSQISRSMLTGRTRSQLEEGSKWDSQLRALMHSEQKK